MAEQLTLVLDPPPARARTWATARPGQRITYQMPSSEWRGTWTIRRIRQHPASHTLLIVDLAGSDGRTWATWVDRGVAYPGPGFAEANDAG